MESLADYLSDLKKRVYLNHWLLYFNPIARSLASPLFKRVFQGWDPLQNPSHGLELVSKWKDFLDIHQGLTYSNLVSVNIFPADRMSSSINTGMLEKLSRCLNFWIVGKTCCLLLFLIPYWIQLLCQKFLVLSTHGTPLPKLIRSMSWCSRGCKFWDKNARARIR